MKHVKGDTVKSARVTGLSERRVADVELTTYADCYAVTRHGREGSVLIIEKNTIKVWEGRSE